MKVDNSSFASGQVKLKCNNNSDIFKKHSIVHLRGLAKGILINFPQTFSNWRVILLLIYLPLDLLSLLLGFPFPSLLPDHCPTPASTAHPGSPSPNAHTSTSALEPRSQASEETVTNFRSASVISGCILLWADDNCVLFKESHLARGFGYIPLGSSRMEQK